MCLTAKLCKLTENEGKEQLWQSLPRTAKLMKAEKVLLFRSITGGN